MPVDAHVGERAAHHLAPTGRGVVDAQAQKGEAGFGENGHGNAQGHGDDDGRDGIGHQVARGNAYVRGAHGARGQDVIPFAQGEKLGAQEARHVQPGDQADGDDHVAEAAAEDGDEQQGQHEGRDGRHDLHQAHDDEIGLAAQHARGQPQGYADEQGDELHAQPHAQGNARAVNDTRIEIPSHLVSAEPVFPGRKLKRLGHVGFRIAVRGDEIGKDGHEDEHTNDDEADDGQLVAHEAPGRIAEEGAVAELGGRRCPGRRRQGSAAHERPLSSRTRGSTTT